MQTECKRCLYVHKSESYSVSKLIAHLSSHLILSQRAVFVLPQLWVSPCIIISLEVGTLLSAESPPLTYYFRCHACFLFNIHTKPENICRRWSVASYQNLPSLQTQGRKFQSTFQFIPFHLTYRSFLFWRVTKCHSFESTTVFLGDIEFWARWIQLFEKRLVWFFPRPQHSVILWKSAKIALPPSLNRLCRTGDNSWQMEANKCHNISHQKSFNYCQWKQEQIKNEDLKMTCKPRSKVNEFSLVVSFPHQTSGGFVYTQAYLVWPKCMMRLVLK